MSELKPLIIKGYTATEHEIQMVGAGNPEKILIYENNISSVEKVLFRDEDVKCKIIMNSGTVYYCVSFTFEEWENDAIKRIN